MLVVLHSYMNAYASWSPTVSQDKPCDSMSKIPWEAWSRVLEWEASILGYPFPSRKLPNSAEQLLFFSEISEVSFFPFIQACQTLYYMARSCLESHTVSFHSVSTSLIRKSKYNLSGQPLSPDLPLRPLNPTPQQVIWQMLLTTASPVPSHMDSNCPLYPQKDQNNYSKSVRKFRSTGCPTPHGSVLSRQ